MASKTLELKSVKNDALAVLDRLGAKADWVQEGGVVARSPVTGEIIGRLRETSQSEIATAIEAAHSAFLQWRLLPAPRRGEFVRLLGEELRASKADLATLVTLEAGKITSEALGEVQEMIDICDFAVGLSRQLYGLSIATERASHRMMETWHPLGVVGVISAFNFPVAVWAWNAALAFVCGDAVVWKPSEKTPLTALAVESILQRAAVRFGDAPAGLSKVLIGARAVGEALVEHPRVQLVSATGSTEMGRKVGQKLAARFARALLELGGNNAAIITPSADQKLALRGVAFAAMGTAGQRCTSLRRLFVHESVYDEFVPRLKAAYGSVPVGDPRADGVLIGPLIDEAAFRGMEKALSEARKSGRVTGGDRVETAASPEAYFVHPALVEMDAQTEVVLRETFAPILYVMRYTDLNMAIELQNASKHGLSSSIFTLDMREAERFTASHGSDCGIANVNIGPSGAEIGGAFGGEKETGGGRESGSDSWRAYMRRATNTVNFGADLPLAQGVKFDV